MDRETLSEARKHLGDLVDRARHAGRPTMLTDHGAPAAVVMPPNTYQELQELRAAHDEQAFRQRIADTTPAAVTLPTPDDVTRFFDELGGDPAEPT